MSCGPNHLTSKYSNFAPISCSYDLPRNLHIIYMGRTLSMFGKCMAEELFLPLIITIISVQDSGPVWTSVCLGSFPTLQPVGVSSDQHPVSGCLPKNGFLSSILSFLRAAKREGGKRARKLFSLFEAEPESFGLRFNPWTWVIITNLDFVSCTIEARLILKCWMYYP